MILICLLVAVCFWQVFSRFVLVRPTPWSEGVARGAMLWFVFLSLPAAFHMGAMVTLDLYRRLPAAVQPVFIVLSGAASCAVLTLAVWYGLKMIGIVRYQTLAGLGISIAWSYAAVPVGCALALPTVILRTIDFLLGDSPTDDVEAHV